MLLVRRVKGAVGRCPRCGSDAVYSQSGKYGDGKRHWSVTCSLKECGNHTPGYNSKEAALAEWESQCRSFLSKREGSVVYG